MASQKSKLLDPIRAIDNATVSAPSAASCASGVIIFDLSVIVSQNADKPFSTFKDFFQFIWKKLLFEGRNHGRMDIVTDNYTKRNVLKEGTQLLNRGSGTTVHLDPDSKFPPDFRKNFHGDRNSHIAIAAIRSVADFFLVGANVAAIEGQGLIKRRKKGEAEKSDIPVLILSMSTIKEWVELTCVISSPPIMHGTGKARETT